MVIMPKEKQLVHARINSPILVRKTLLESAILATEILKSYQKTKKIRAQKLHYKSQLRNNLQEIKSLVDKLEMQELPKPPSITKPSAHGKADKEIKQEKTKRINQERLLESKSTELDIELKKLQERLKNL